MPAPIPSARCSAAALLALAGMLLAPTLGCSRQSDTPASASSGRLQIKGSDTMVHLVTNWAQAYMQEHPDTRIAVTGGGSGTGIKAIINGTAELCMSSREASPEERSQAAARGRGFFEYPVCLDGIAVVVHPDNPIEALSLEQLRAIFTGGVKRWRELGGPDEPITVLSRESNSGTYVFFREHVLGGADFDAAVRLMPASAAIVQAVSQDRWSIGYVGLGYAQAAPVKVVAVRADEATAPVRPTPETVRQRLYPIARPLYLYAVREPHGLVKAFIEFALSPRGQQIAAESGYVPLAGEPGSS